MSTIGYTCVGLLLFACAGDEPTQRQQCERMRDHLVDLRVGDLPAGTERQLVSQHRAAMTRALGGEFIATCEQKFDKRQVDCAVSAHDLSAANECVDR